jgi:hypothetical protein
MFLKCFMCICARFKTKERVGERDGEREEER